MPRHEDDDDRPRRRPRPRDDDEEEERPRSRSRRPRDDDEDERPRSRRPRDDEEEDRPRRKSRRERDEDDYDDRPRRKSRPKTPELNVAGAVAIGIGALALVLTITPCLSIWFGIVPAIIGLLVGLVGLYTSHQSDGRQRPTLPFLGMGISVVAVLISVVLMVAFKGLERAGEKFVKEIEAEAAKAEAERKVELDKTAKEVQSATNPIRITAENLSREYDQNEEQTDARYEGKVLEVTGIIDSVDFDDLEDEYRVSLKTGTDDTVDCDFLKNPAILARLKQLKPGDRVTIRGKYIGTTILEGCILVN